MAVYTGSVTGITPSLTDDNLFLENAANEYSMVREVQASGEAAASTVMRTRWALGTGHSGAATAGNVQKHHPNSPTNLVTFGTTFASVQPTLAAASFMDVSWNAFGGLVEWKAADEDEEWVSIGAATTIVLACRNAVGVGTSTYKVVWKEP